MSNIYILSSTSLILLSNILLFKNIKRYFNSVLENYFQEANKKIFEHLHFISSEKKIGNTCEPQIQKTVCSRECGTDEAVDFINVCKH